MTKCLAQILPLMVSFLLITCKDTGMVPDEPKPGRRDYVWTVDTLTITDGYFSPSRIWGSASNDVWLVCTGSPTRNLVWHFDGSKWVNDATPRPIDPCALFGISAANIWMANVGNAIWKFDGTSWTGNSIFEWPGTEWSAIEDIWGESADNVWGVGVAGYYSNDDQLAVLAHCDGDGWLPVTIPQVRAHFVGVRVQHSTGLVFIDSWHEGRNVDSCKVYTFQWIGGLRQIYGGLTEVTVEELQGEVYFIDGQKILKHVGDGFVLWRDFGNTGYAGWLKGRSEKDFFGVGKDGSIMHYNGSDFAVVRPNRLHVANLLVVGSSVFAVCFDPQMTLASICVIRGTLREGG